MRGWLWVLLVGCNRAPLDYRDVGPAPGSDVPWAGPSDDACEARSDAMSSQVIDGFLFCSAGDRIQPIDEPVHAPCDAVELPGDTDVFWATDGLTARAWPTAMLQGRELVHEDWPLGPVLVDW